jgi:mRNA interferase HigB
MVIISKGIIHGFAGKHPGSIQALNEWYFKVKKANWRNPSEMVNDFNSVDALENDRFVFDISGNHYRLVALIHYNIRTIYIRGIFTHVEYDRLGKTGRLNLL